MPARRCSGGEWRNGALAIGFISAVMGTKIPGAGSIFISASIRFNCAGEDRRLPWSTTCRVAEIRDAAMW